MYNDQNELNAHMQTQRTAKKNEKSNDDYDDGDDDKRNTSTRYNK